MVKFFMRSSIILFWIVLLFMGLYWPKWKILNYEANSINIFAWGDILEPSVIADFERETGIKIYLNYYSSNEELLVKVKATRGEGYDLIIPSDYAVSHLAHEGLLKELDKSKLNFLHNINPVLLNHAYDPENRYSIPFEWELFGLGIDKEFFEGRSFRPSWKYVFDPKSVYYNITMINDPIETVLLAGYYLYGNIDTLTPAQTEAVKQVLFQQKNWVEAYADFRGDYFLATRNCPLVVASSSYIERSKRQFPFIDFVVPDEGTFLSIENISIPAACSKDALVYKFINYLFRPESVARHFNTYGFFPSTIDAMPLLSSDERTKAIIQSSPASFKKYHFTKELLPEQQVQDLWVELKTYE